MVFLCKFGQIHQLVQEIECRQSSFYSLYSVVTLKIRSRSPKSDQIFKPSQRYNTWSLARIRHLVQEIGCTQAFVFGKNLIISKCSWILENEVKVTKILTLLSSLPIMCLCKFGQNPPIGSGDRSADNEQCWRDLHRKQYISPPLRLHTLSVSL